MKKTSYIFLTVLIVLSGVAFTGIDGPYEIDSDTLHLYHFDGNGDDAVSGNAIDLSLNDGATAVESSVTGFGSALNTYDGVGGEGPLAEASSNIDASNFMGVDGAFTFEAIIQPLVELNAIPNEMEIISGEGDQANDRGWQYRINTSGMIEFNNISVVGNNPSFAIPTTGDHAFEAGQWYHVAVTYNGQENTSDNLKMYWTRLDANVDQAQLIGTFQMTGDIDSSRRIDFVVGNEGRSTGGHNENFEGLIDEVRISSIARGADEMMITQGDGVPVIITHPADATMQQAVTATFEILFTSDSTPVALWYKMTDDGDVLVDSESVNTDVTLTDAGADEYTARLIISDLQIDDAGQYYCSISNESAWSTNSHPAALIVQGMVAHWTLDYGRSNATHYLEELGGLDAAFEGTASFVEGVDGSPAGAALMTATDGWAQVPVFDVVQQAGAMSISFWVNWYEASGTEQDVQMSGTDGDSLVMTDGLKADDRWQQVCMVFDGTTGKLYVDGVLRDEGPWQMPENTDAVIKIGVQADGSNPFNGAMDDIRMYNYALTDEQVADLRYNLSGDSSCILVFDSIYDITGADGAADCVVDLLDLAELTSHFLSSDPTYDFTGPAGSPDGVVDLNELAGLSADWLTCGLYPVCE